MAYYNTNDGLYQNNNGFNNIFFVENWSMKCQRLFYLN